MKKLLLATAVCAWLGGCTTMGEFQQNYDQIVLQVQKTAVQLCGFEPLAATIVNIISAGQFTGYFSIAQAICAAIAQQGGDSNVKGARRAPTVSGVRIRGHYVGRRV